jgi:hypothetical protein
MQSLSVILFKYKDSVNNMNRTVFAILAPPALVLPETGRPDSPAKAVSFIFIP